MPDSVRRRVVAALTTPFAVRLAVITLVGVVVRVVYVLVVAADRPLFGDALSYHLWAEQIAAGNGMVAVTHEQVGVVVDEPTPTAELAPLFPHVLGLVAWLGATTIAAQKVAMACVGAITVAILGAAGREAAGARVGLIAAAIAAVYPFLWVPDGSLMSETLYGVWLALLLLVGFRLGRGPTLRLAVAYGVLVAVAGLTRGEALLLGPLVLVPIAWAHRDDLVGRVRLLAAGGLAAVLVLAPWTIRNLSEFEEPVLIANNANAVFAGANCPSVYEGRWLGLWTLECNIPAPPGDESERAVALRQRGIDHLRDNLDRLPVVVAARVGRAWELYHPIDQANYEVLEGRPREVSLAGLAMYYPLVGLAAVGVWRIRRERRLLVPALAPLVVVCIVAVVVYGVTRFRFTAEPALVVLGAVGIDHLVQRRARSAVPEPASAPH